jgi:hypothetical protein
MISFLCQFESCSGVQEISSSENGEDTAYKYVPMQFLASMVTNVVQWASWVIEA